MKSLLKILYYLLVVGILGMGLLLLATLIPIPGNFIVKIVKSGSMEPAIKTGGIVVIRPAGSYAVGDIITFGKDTKTQIPTTHRIVEIQKGSFLTKGDANDTVDPAPVMESEVKGKLIFSLPYIGFVLDFAKKPLGFALLVGLPALLVIIDEFLKIWWEIKSLREKKTLSTRNKEDSVGMRSMSNVLDLRRVRREVIRTENPNPKYSYLKTLLIFLVPFLSLIGLSSISSTVSYYNESEHSTANTLQASAVYPGAPTSSIESLVLGESTEETEDPPVVEGDEVVDEVVEVAVEPEVDEPEEQVVEESEPEIEEPEIEVSEPIVE